MKKAGYLFLGTGRALRETGFNYVPVEFCEYLFADQQGHDQQGDDVDHLNHGVHGRTGGVLVGVAHRVTGNRSLVGIGAFAAI